jgi:hypothetical protein
MDDAATAADATADDAAAAADATTDDVAAAYGSGDYYVEVVWQYEFPYQLDKTTGPADDPKNGSAVFEHAMESDAFNLEGGSIRRLANGNYLLAFTSLDDNRKWNPRGSSYIFEVILVVARPRHNRGTCARRPRATRL